MKTAKTPIYKAAYFCSNVEHSFEPVRATKFFEKYTLLVDDEQMKTEWTVILKLILGIYMECSFFPPALSLVHVTSITVYAAHTFPFVTGRVFCVQIGFPAVAPMTPDPVNVECVNSELVNSIFI